jgi:hypothetical protein
MGVHKINTPNKKYLEKQINRIVYNKKNSNVRVAKHIDPVRPNPAERDLGLRNHETDKQQVERQKAGHQQVGGRRRLDEIGAQVGERDAG